MANLIPPSAVVNSFAELSGRATGLGAERCSRASPTPAGADTSLLQSPTGLPAFDSVSLRSGNSDVDGSNQNIDKQAQTAAAHEMHPEDAACIEASPKGTREGSPIHQPNFQHRACESMCTPSAASQADISLDVAVRDTPTPDPPLRAALTPVRSVTQAYARLGITAKDAHVWDSAAWRIEWKSCGAASSQNTNLWRIQAIHYIMQHRCTSFLFFQHSTWVALSVFICWTQGISAQNRSIRMNDASMSTATITYVDGDIWLFKPSFVPKHACHTVRCSSWACMHRKDQLEQHQAPLRKRLEELQMELAQQMQLLAATDVELHARPTALEQKQNAGRLLRSKWVGGSLGAKSGNVTRKVAYSLSPDCANCYLQICSCTLPTNCSQFAWCSLIEFCAWQLGTCHNCLIST